MQKQCVVTLLVFFGSSFVLHFGWESAQMPFFKSDKNATLFENAQMCLFATATGDMLFMLTLYVALAVIHKNVCWLTDRISYSHPATWFVPILIGVLLAVSFELWAIHAVRRWEYKSSMPLIPFVGVGLIPILQMILIPPIVIAVCRYLAITASRALDA